MEDEQERSDCFIAPEALASILEAEFRLPGVSLTLMYRGVASEIWEVKSLGSQAPLWVRVVDGVKSPQSLHSQVTWLSALGKCAEPNSGLKMQQFEPTAKGAMIVEVDRYSLCAFRPLEGQSNQFLDAAAGGELLVKGAQTLAAVHAAGLRALANGAAAPHTSGFIPSARIAGANLPRVVLHGDFHPGNVLLMERGSVGVIDFEYARHDLRLWDLAYAIIFFCVDWHHDIGALDRRSVSEFVEIYQRCTSTDSLAVTPREKELIPDGIRVICAANIEWVKSLQATPVARSSDRRPHRSAFERLMIGSQRLIGEPLLPSE